MDAVAAGSRDLRRDPSLQAARDFAAGFIFARRRHARTRLFLRAEDVFGYTGRLAADMAELGTIEQELAQLPEGSGRDRATAMARGERAALDPPLWRQPRRPLARRNILGTLAHPAGAERAVFPRRAGDVPLSPSRVLALIALLAECVGQGCQFVIATHSPILMVALPGGDDPARRGRRATAGRVG